MVTAGRFRTPSKFHRRPITGALQHILRFDKTTALRFQLLGRRNHSEPWLCLIYLVVTIGLVTITPVTGSPEAETIERLRAHRVANIGLRGALYLLGVC